MINAVLAAASGTGKTTITGPLRRRLPGCDISGVIAPGN